MNDISELHKEYSQRELSEFYTQAIKEDSLVVARLINQVWLLQDLLTDERDNHNRTRATLHELRAQIKK